MKVPCPQCERETYDFCIVDGRCDKCRNEAEREKAAPHQLTLADVRDERNRRLTDCDWTQLPDVAEEVRLKWQPYRQALRDLPLDADPQDMVWPEPPK